MSTTHQDKSGGKPRQRSRKTDQRGQKSERQQSPKLDQKNEDQIGAMIASTNAPTNGAVVPDDVPSIGEVEPADAPLIGGVEPADVPSLGAAVSADNYPINI